MPISRPIQPFRFGEKHTTGVDDRFNGGQTLSSNDESVYLISLRLHERIKFRCRA